MGEALQPGPGQAARVAQGVAGRASLISPGVVGRGVRVCDPPRPGHHPGQELKAKDKQIIQRDPMILEERREAAKELRNKDTKIQTLQEDINALKSSVYDNCATK